VADLNNVGGGPFAGAILAALFLERFVEKTTPWAHLDVMAWNPSSKPGRPEGGEALGMRAVYSYLENRYAKSA
jgi:leucyl aminopeptidase